MVFADVVTKALLKGGAELLDDPRRLLSYLRDYAGDDSFDEMIALTNNCDESLIAPFREALAQESAEALATAATRAAHHLTVDCVIDKDVAQRAAEGISMGIAQWRGIAYTPSTSVASAATADETQLIDPFASREVVPLIPTATVKSAARSMGVQQYPSQQKAVAYPSTVSGQFRPEAPSVAPSRRYGALIGGVVGVCVALLLLGVIVLVSGRGGDGATEETLPQQDAQVSVTVQPAEPEVEETEPTTTSDTEAEDSEQELITLMASDYDGVMMRSGAGMDYGEVESLDPSDVMDYYGESEMGPSSSGTSLWYKVIARGKEGWVCSDYVEELPGTVTVLVARDGDPINMRMLPEYGSTIVGQSEPGATIYWYGQVQSGVCSDGVVRDWYIINSGGNWGWARADNLVRQ